MCLTEGRNGALEALFRVRSSVLDRFSGPHTSSGTVVVSVDNQPPRSFACTRQSSSAARRPAWRSRVLEPTYTDDHFAKQPRSRLPTVRRHALLKLGVRCQSPRVGGRPDRPEGGRQHHLKSAGSQWPVRVRLPPPVPTACTGRFLPPTSGVLLAPLVARRLMSAVGGRQAADVISKTRVQ